MKVQEKVREPEESVSSLRKIPSVSGLQKEKVIGGLWAAAPLWVCWQVSRENPGAVLLNRIKSEELGAEKRRVRMSWNYWHIHIP